MLVTNWKKKTKREINKKGKEDSSEERKKKKSSIMCTGFIQVSITVSVRDFYGKG